MNCYGGWSYLHLLRKQAIVWDQDLIGNAEPRRTVVVAEQRDLSQTPSEIFGLELTEKPGGGGTHYDCLSSGTSLTVASIL